MSDTTHSVKVILTRGGRVLVLKDSRSDFHDLPGGHVHEDEGNADALKREVMEETGLRLDWNTLRCLGARKLMLEGRTWDVTFYAAEAEDGDVKLSDEHTDFLWAQPSKLEKMNLGVFLPVVQDALEGGVQASAKGSPLSDLAEAVGKCLVSIGDALDPILRVEDDHAMLSKLRAFRDDFEAFSDSLLDDPAPALALEASAAKGFSDGLRMAGKVKASEQTVRAGDVPGHEFHGNQWTEGGYSVSSDVRAKTDALHAMPESERDDIVPGDYGIAAYHLYEAEKLMPKVDGAKRNVTDDNSFKLNQIADAVFNVGGKPYLGTKQEDPDDENETVWHFHSPVDPFAKGFESAFKDHKLAVDEFRQHLARQKH